MNWVDRIVGLDDERARRERAPLWKRAVWRALKALVRKHPGAVVSAAGTAAGYAATQGLEEGAEAVKDGAERGVGAIKDKAHEVEAALMPAAENDTAEAAAVPDAAQGVRQLSEEEKRDLVDALSPQDRSALADLAKKN